MGAKPIGALVGDRAGVPVIFHARNIHDEPWIEKKTFQTLATFDATKLVICNSNASAAPYAEVVPQKVTVVPNFVDFRRFDRTRFEPRLREELGLPDDAVVVGYAGRLRPWKGVDLLIRAFAKVHEAHPKAVLVILGDTDAAVSTDLRVKYRKLARRLGVANKTFFIGFRDDVRPYMADYDLLVLPSLRPEPFGRVVIEAMALGVPTVISGRGGAAEIVRDGVDGLWARPRDADDFASKIGELLADPDERRAFGEEAARAVRARYDGEVVSRELTRLIRSVACRPLSRSRSSTASSPRGPERASRAA